MRAHVLAIIANEQTAYRLNLHRRIVREVPEAKLLSIFTHEDPGPLKKWKEDSSIRPMFFGAGERAADRMTPRAVLREWRKAVRIVECLRAHSVTCVILVGYNDVCRLRVLQWCKRSGVPCYVFGDSNVLGDNAGFVKRFIKRMYLSWVNRTASGILYCGRCGREYFLRYGAKASQLFPFPYEPEYSAIEAAGDAEAEAAERQFALPCKRRRLLFVGRLVREKRPDLLLEAFLAVNDVRTEWDLVFAGEGPMRSGLEESVPRELRDRVHFTGFVESREDLAGLYAACDVFVLPSDFEPWGVVLAEAATRMPIIASSVVGSAADLVEEGENGVIFEAGDLQCLMEAVVRVTSEEAVMRMKAESPRILKRWRSETDPIRTLRWLMAAEDVTING